MFHRHQLKEHGQIIRMEITSMASLLKGIIYGALHKVVLSDEIVNQELILQRDLRESRAREFIEIFENLNAITTGSAIQTRLADAAKEMTERIRELGPNPLKKKLS